MAGSLIDADSATETQFKPLVDLAARLRAHPLTVTLAQPLTDLYEAQWIPLRDAETALVVAQIDAQAQVWFAGLSINESVATLERVLRGAVNKDRLHPSYVFFFGKRRVHEIAKLALDAKLEALAGWVEAVSGSPFPQVKALGPELAQRIAAGEAARDALQAATEKLRAFRRIGPRKDFTDAFNALRKSTLGKLAEMPHTVKDQALPKSFADWFFPPSRKTPPQPSSADIAAQIAEKEAQHKAEIEALEQQRKDALAREVAEAQDKAREAQRLADLAEAKKEEAAAKAKRKSLETPKRSRRSPK
jgi:hypothetical protein